MVRGRSCSHHGSEVNAFTSLLHMCYCYCVCYRCVSVMAMYRMMSRRLGFFLCFIGFVWGIALINTTLQSNEGPRHSDELKVRAAILVSVDNMYLHVIYS